MRDQCPLGGLALALMAFAISGLILLRHLENQTPEPMSPYRTNTPWKNPLDAKAEELELATAKARIIKLQEVGDRLHRDLVQAKEVLREARVHAYVGERSMADWRELMRP